MTTYYFPVDPVGKVRMTQSDKWKVRPAVDRYRAYADRLRELGCNLHDGDEITFWIKMPESWSNKKKLSMVGLAHRSKPDLDNLLGALMDAVSPDGDSHYAVFGEIRKYWGDEGAISITRYPRPESPESETSSHPSPEASSP